MSKEKQFTPGPWEVSQDNGWRCGVLTSDDHFFIECETVSDKNEACFENDANARLIAAAPEMYELLEYIRNTISETDKSPYYALPTHLLTISTQVDELLKDIINND